MGNIHAFHDLRIEVEEIIDLGERVLAHTCHRATGRVSGIPYKGEITDLVTVRGSQVVRWETYWKREEALKAAGLSE